MRKKKDHSNSSQERKSHSIHVFLPFLPATKTISEKFEQTKKLHKTEGTNLFWLSSLPLTSKITSSHVFAVSSRATKFSIIKFHNKLVLSTRKDAHDRRFLILFNIILLSREPQNIFELETFRFLLFLSSVSFFSLKHRRRSKLCVAI